MLGNLLLQRCFSTVLDTLEVNLPCANSLQNHYTPDRTFLSDKLLERAEVAQLQYRKKQRDDKEKHADCRGLPHILVDPAATVQVLHQRVSRSDSTAIGHHNHLTKNEQRRFQRQTKHEDLHQAHAGRRSVRTLLDCTG